jgi:hypothetical protein
MKKHFVKYIPVILLLIFASASNGYAQLSILNANVNSYNITPASLCQVSIMNGLTDMQVYLEADLMAADNTLLLKVTTNPFMLKKGLNNLGMNVSVGSAQYGSDNISKHIGTFHTLPAGKYHYCCTIKIMSHVETGDQYCEDLESENNSFMTLVFPGDHDTIESPMPLLCWSHSDPFNITSGGEYYRMKVVELHEGQNAEAGLVANVPVYIKTNVGSHQVQYPYDAKPLLKGMRYGWEVEKVSNEVVVNKTEAWEFVVQPDRIEVGHKYAILKPTLDAGYYVALDNKVYFRIDEAYVSRALEYRILDAKNKEVSPPAHNENKTLPKAEMKATGYNRFCIDLEGYDLKEGYYTLEVNDSKSEKLLLKFYVK